MSTKSIIKRCFRVVIVLRFSEIIREMGYKILLVNIEKLTLTHFKWSIIQIVCKEKKWEKKCDEFFQLLVLW